MITHGPSPSGSGRLMFMIKSKEASLVPPLELLMEDLSVPLAEELAPRDLGIILLFYLFSEYRRDLIPQDAKLNLS